MGIVQRLLVLLRGEEEERGGSKEREVEPVAGPRQAPKELVAESVRVPSPEPQAPPLASGVTAKEAEPDREREPTPKAAGIKKVVLDEAAVSILDLRELPSSRFRIVGSAYWVTDSGRYKHGGAEYLLVREPKNKWDANAVAVYGKGRKVGHLTEAKAAALAPIFDELPFDAYRVGGAPPARNSIVMWVDLPALSKLRAFIKTIVKTP